MSERVAAVIRVALARRRKSKKVAVGEEMKIQSFTLINKNCFLAVI